MLGLYLRSALPWLGPGKRSFKDHRHNGEVFAAAPNSMRTLEEIWEKPKTPPIGPFHTPVCSSHQSRRPLQTGTHRAHRRFRESRGENHAGLRSSRPWCFCDRVSVKVVRNAVRWVNAIQAALFSGAGRALVRSCARLLGLGHAVAHKVIFLLRAPSTKTPTERGE